MTHLTPEDKLMLIEDAFQKWFHKAFELKDYYNVNTDTLVRELPRAKSPQDLLVRYRFYATRFKSSIKVPQEYHDNPRRFIPALGKYFIDSAKLLYTDRIRYEYTGFTSEAPGDWCWIDVYKSCGDDVGCFCLKFQVDGNLVVAEVGYQIFGQVIPLTSPPGLLRPFTHRGLFENGRVDPGSSEGCGVVLVFIIAAISLFILMRAYVFPHNENRFIDMIGGLGFMLLFFLFPLAKQCLFGDNVDPRRLRVEIAIQQDLSPIHFPVRYFNNDEFNDAFSKSHDHLVFFKQLSAVVDHMSALGDIASRAE